MSADDRKRLYGRWLSELCNGDLALAEEIAPFAEADLVAARWKGPGTFGDGTPVTMHGHHLLRVESGRLAEHPTLSEPPAPVEAP